VQIFDRTFAITYALEAIAILVAVMGVAGALLALVIDRRRELGLLRYLGASSAQLRKLILAEAGLLGLLANLSGVILGFFLSLILIFVINKQSFGWTIRLHWPIAVLLGGTAVVCLATLLAGYYPARVAISLNPVEVCMKSSHHSAVAIVCALVFDFAACSGAVQAGASRISLRIPARFLQPSGLPDGVVVLHRESAGCRRTQIRLRTHLFPRRRQPRYIKNFLVGPTRRIPGPLLRSAIWKEKSFSTPNVPIGPDPELPEPTPHSKKSGMEIGAWCG